MLEKQNHSSSSKNRRSTYKYTGLITCAICGAHFRRRNTSAGHVWICNTFMQKGKTFCPSRQIPEYVLDDLCKGLDVYSLIAKDNRIIQIETSDGTILEKQWKNKSRSCSWTDEMKEQARRKAKERCE